MILVAIDAEGTLDKAGGPVPWNVILFLHTYTPPGLVRFVLAADGLAALPAGLGLPTYVGSVDRGGLADALGQAAAEYPWMAERHVLTSRAGFPGHFVAGGWNELPPERWPEVVKRVTEAVAEFRGRSPRPQA